MHRKPFGVPKAPHIAVLGGICVHGDAISESIRGTIIALEQKLGAKCRLYTYACDYPEFDACIVKDVSDVLLDPFFLSADLIVYHFGIYYEFFNAILVGNGKAKQIVYYHNVTPKEWVAASAHKTIEKSMRQRANLDCADEIWAVSEFNKQDLMEYGIAAAEAPVFPLYCRLAHDYKLTKPDDQINILYVGRFVQSKGVLDLIETVGIVARRLPSKITLSLVGNVDFSDTSYINKLKAKITELELGGTVKFKGKVNDDTLRRYYENAHIFAIASYHEGFCVPLVEAMHAGCVPIGYSAGNIASLIGDYGVVVPTGDKAGLADAVENVARFIAQNGADSADCIPWGRSSRSMDGYRSELSAYVESFTFEAFAERISSRVATLLTGKDAAFSPPNDYLPAEPSTHEPPMLNSV